MTTQQPNTTPTILRRRQVERITTLSRSTIYARLGHNPKRPSDFDPTFPRPIRLGPKAVGWIATEVEEWIAKQVAARDEVTGGDE